MARRRNSTSMSESQAKTLIQQMGGYGNLRMMLGKKLSFMRGYTQTGYPELTMTFPNRKGPNIVKIALTPEDTYSVRFFRRRGYDATPKGEHSHVYAGDLKRLIEKETGLRLSLRNPRHNGGWYKLRVYKTPHQYLWEAGEWPSLEKARAAAQKHLKHGIVYVYDEDGKKVETIMKRKNPRRNGSDSPYAYDRWSTKLVKAFPKTLTGGGDALGKQVWGNATFRFTAINFGTDMLKDMLIALDDGGVFGPRPLDEDRFFEMRDFIAVKLRAAVQKKKGKSNPRRNGRQYDYDEWLDFLAEDAFARDSAGAMRSQKAYEDRVEALLDMAMEEGLFEDYPDVQEIAYLSYASQAGQGVGLWEGREPWHEDFEAVVMADPGLSRIFTNIESL